MTVPTAAPIVFEDEFIEGLRQLWEQKIVFNQTLGLRVVSLHRVSFCGVTIKGLAEGNWAELSESEMAVVNRALDKAGGGTGDKPMKVFDDPEE